MEKRFWILAAGILASVPVNAQPVAPVEGGAGRNEAAGVSIRELEERIGGRTTLELKFEGATRDQVLAALSQSSGLPFGPTEPGYALGFEPAGGAEEPLYKASVSKMDFWPAMRAWNRAEEARLQTERAAQQARRSQDKPPFEPEEVRAGATSGVAVEAWRAAREQWMQRRMQQSRRFSASQLLSVAFNPARERWSLRPGNEIASGRALSSWPCFILATGLRRSQNLSISEDEPQPGTQAGAKASANVGAPKISPEGVEAVEGGSLSDSLLLNLAVYIEPKLQARAKVSVQFSEVRDDVGEDLLSEQSKNGPLAGQGMPYSSLSNGVLSSSVGLKPRQARGKKIARLRGVVTLRYPMQVQQHEMTDFNAPHLLPMAVAGYQAQVQIEPPRLEGGHFVLSSVAEVRSPTGHHDIARPTSSSSLGRWEGIFFSEQLLPSMSKFSFVDSQGRTWRGQDTMGQAQLQGPQGKIVPLTSPPQPVPDNFTYTERRHGVLTPVPPNSEPHPTNGPRFATPGGIQSTGTATYMDQGAVFSAPALPPAELAQVRFTKATFTTESDWRTIAVPFEFHDLPLPPR